MRSLLCLLLLAMPAAAQTMTPTSIVFTGVPYAQADLLAQSGLTPRKPVSKDEIEAAMHRLDDTGLFGGIQYSAAGGVLTFALEPMAGKLMQRVEYTNFVWYTADQLNAEVRAKVPLFNGTVPGEGDMAARVERALEAIVQADHSLAVQVRSVAVKGGRLDFSIASPQVQVGAVKVQNVDFQSDPVLSKVYDGLAGAEFLGRPSLDAVRMNVAYALQELGFLDATVGPVTRSDPKLQPGLIVIDLTAVAAPGDRYKVGRVTLPEPEGTIKAPDFVSDNQVQAGGVPSPSLAKNTQLRLEHVYQDHGYLDAAVTMDAARDKAAHTVNYTYAVVPGGVYRMRSLVFDVGMSSAQQSQFTQAWKLPRGSDYNGQQAGLSRMQPGVKTICAGRPVSMTLVPEKKSHEVDVTVSCTAGGRRVGIVE